MPVLQLGLLKQQHMSGSHLHSDSLTVKLLFTTVIMLVLLIPMYFVQDIISEREAYHQEVQKEIAKSWGEEQVITGPFLTIPYEESVMNIGQTAYVEGAVTVKQLHLLPEKLDVQGELKPQIKKRGIYEMPVYTSNLRFSGYFSSPELDTGRTNRKILWDQAILTMGIPDVKGIVKMDVKLENKDVGMHTITSKDPPVFPGVQSSVSVAANSPVAFEANLAVRGSDSFSIVPVGTTSTVNLTSPWQDPSFIGSSLPEKASEDLSEGFDATWKVLELNRPLPAQFTGTRSNWKSYGFGVRILDEVNDYRKTERSAKYAILFIVLTFVALVVAQLLQNRWLQPLQIGMIGLGLCLFYLLLLSLSEAIGFNLAYLIAALAIVLQSAWYVRFLFGSWSISLTIGGIMGLLYGFIFVLVQLAMYSLLMGSVGLFIVLGVLMYLSRKLPAPKKRPEVQPPPIPQP